MKNLNFFIFLLLPWCCLAQVKLPLKTILGQIAEKHHIRFSYIEEELAVYTMVPPDQSMALQSKLDYIEQRTRLEFKAITANYYTIYNDIRMDKPLCGYLIDAKTGMGIENAQVIISGRAISVASDSRGYFELPLLAPNAITIRHLGYKENTINPQDLYVPDCPKLYMEPVTEALQEVATQRYLATGMTKTDTGEILVRPGQFGILPGLAEPDILKAMQQVPGITSIDETVSNINVRGGTHDQNLFLWNGIRMFQTGHFFGLISAFNPYLATRIKISKNGSSAFYGESVSSLVDISSHTRAIDSCYNAMSVDLISANFFSKVKLSKKATFQAAGRRTFTDIFTSPAYKQYENRVFRNTIVTDLSDTQQVPIDADEKFRFYDFSIQYHQKIGERHDLVIDGIAIENILRLNEYSTTRFRNSTLGQRNFGGSLSWKTQWNDKQQTELQAYWSHYVIGARDADFTQLQLTDQQNSVSNKGIRLRHNYSISEKLETSVGYQLDELNVGNTDEVTDPFFSRHIKSVSISHAIIAEAQFKSANGTSVLRGGFRGNYFEKFGLLLVEPRLVWNSKIRDSWSFQLLGEQKSQTLSQIVDRQQDFLGIEKRRWTLANNNDIPVQKSSQASFGITYNRDGWLLTAEPFYKKVTGITSAEQGFVNQFEFANATGNYYVSGTEMLLKKTFTRFYSWISYSFNENRYHFDQFSPARFANNVAVVHAVNWAAVYEWQQLRVALGTQWHTGKPITSAITFDRDTDNPANSRVIYATPNNNRLNDYLQVNFAASKNWKVNQKMLFGVSLSVLNIFNRRNEIDRYYRVNTTSNSFESVTAVSLSRTPDVSLKLLF